MLFNSFQFALFLPIVFVLYWFVFNKNLNIRNIFLLVISYIFYACWDYRFLLLIILSTLVDYFIGIKISETNKIKKRKLFLFTSLIVNLGLLGFFKYYNFFIENWIDLMNKFGFNSNLESLNVILPVGISFYTFQTLSYTIDIYKRKITPTNNLVNFAAFVVFFPQLVAGPIERASNLLPQFFSLKKFDFEKARSGLHLIFWGLFKKVVIADSCAIYVNAIFSNYENLNSLTLILGAIYFAFQIYGDFSGYSDIAIGISRLLGFDLMQNFRQPYFSKNIAEFWRRWHISLSTWFRDYVYLPLGGSRVSKTNQVRNVFIIFLVSGFWHGANWTFIFWGLLNAIYFMPRILFYFNKEKSNNNNFSVIQNLKNFIGILITFSFICFAWIFFRSKTIGNAFEYINQILKLKFNIEYLNIERYSIEMLFLLILFVLIEWFSKNSEEPISGKWSYFKLLTCIILIFVLGSFSNPQDFIYFQF